MIMQRFLFILIGVTFCFNIYSQNLNYKNSFLGEVDALYYMNKKIKALDKINLLLDSSNYKIDLSERIETYKWSALLNFELDYLDAAKSSIIKLTLLDDDFSAEKIPHCSLELKIFVEQIILNEEKNYVFINKHKQDMDFVPANVTVYTKDEINELGARDLLDLLRITSGFMEIGDNNERNFASRGVFGTTVQDVLILINYHNINDLLTSSNAPDWLAIDYIEQIEIVRGPGSALYGGNAFSAVINIITKSGKSHNEHSLSFWHGSGSQSSLGLFEDKSLYRFNHQFGKKISNNEEIYFSSTLYSFGGAEINHSASDEVGNVYPDLSPSKDSILFSPVLPGKEFINQYAPSYNLLGSTKTNIFLLPPMPNPLL